MNDEVKKLKCGLVMPISAIDGCSVDHWAEVKEVIEEALNDTQFDVQLVSDSNEIGIIHKRIVQNIYDNDIIVCDVSAKNPNVMLELGMRLAFDKPVIIMIDDKTNYSFDTASIEHLQYPRDLHYHTIQAFKSKLREKVIATYEASLKPEYSTFLKHFGKFVVASIEEKPVGKDEFILSAINEMRTEVGFLAKSIRNSGGYSYSSQRMAELAGLSGGGVNIGGGEIWYSNDRLRNSTLLTSDIKSEIEFIDDYMTNRRPFTNDEIYDPTSKEFLTILKEYLDNHVPHNIGPKSRHVAIIKERLIGAIQSHGNQTN